MVEGCFPISTEPSLVDDSAESVVSEFDFNLDDEAKERFTQSVGNVVEFLKLNESDNKQAWVYLHDPSSGRIDAVVTIELFSVNAGDKDRYKEAVNAEHATDTENVVNRHASFHEVAEGEVIVVNDVLIPPADSVLIVPAIERAITAVFLHGDSMMVEISVLTQDLALFEDIAEFSRLIAGTIEWTPERSSS